MKTVFSGVQPTGQIHLGNYLGAIKQFVTIQDDATCFFCVVDMHAITVKHDSKKLAHDTRQTIATYLACGINPDKARVFAQSHVPAHTEIAWLLSSVARMGWLERMTQFREKTGTVPPDDFRDVLKRIKSNLKGSAVSYDTGADQQMTVGSTDLLKLYDMLAGATDNKEKASVGLFTYPVLMAADILGYKATHVPVGDDQKQHLNLARDIAQKFNNDYGELFPIPEAVRNAGGARIMSLQDASHKMSKSDPDPLSRVSLLDSDDTINKTIRRATADTLPFPSSEEEVSKPEINNLIGIFTEITDLDRESVFKEFGGRGYGTFKPALADALIKIISPIRSKIEGYMDGDQTELEVIMREGAEAAQFDTQATLNQMKVLMGFDMGETL
jgi:tryptophanyl-tRNA synthetase